MHVNLLEQAGCRVTEEVVTFGLLRDKEDSSDEFRERGERWIRRELSRLNALTGYLLEANSISFEPPTGNITINVAAVWGHAPQMPPRHAGWLDEGHEFRIGAWDIASHTENNVLRFVMLDSICESAGVPRNWVNKAAWPHRFAEVRLIRNLIVHGSEQPNSEVLQYLEACTKSILGNRFTNRHKHLELARLRSAHLMSCVWKVVVNGCVDCEVELFSDRPVGLSGIVLEDQGPHSIYAK
jgi:hypothetical protein